MLTFQKDFTDRVDVILFGLYSNPLTWAAQLLFSPVDKGKNLRTGRLCKFLKVTVSLIIGSPSYYPKHSFSSHISPEHVWVIEFKGKKGGGMALETQS